MMPDYNGWADEPEEEREALAEFEMTLANAASKRPTTQAPQTYHPCSGSQCASRRRGLMHDHQNGKGDGAGSPIVYVRSPIRRASRQETWAVYDTSLTPLDPTRGEAPPWLPTWTPGYTLFGPGRQRERLPCFHFGPRIALIPGSFTGMAPVQPGPGDRLFVIAGKEIVTVEPEDV